MEVVVTARLQFAVLVHINHYCSDFQQGIGTRVEPAGFHIHHDRQKAAETGGKRGVSISHRGSSQGAHATRSGRGIKTPVHG